MERAFPNPRVVRIGLLAGSRLLASRWLPGETAPVATGGRSGLALLVEGYIEDVPEKRRRAVMPTSHLHHERRIESWVLAPVATRIAEHARGANRVVEAIVRVPVHP